MIEIHLTRHGETDYNRKGILQGQTDIPLNELGRHQALNLRDKIKNISFAKIYSSDLSRAAETAEISTGIKPHTDKRFRERCIGKYAGHNLIDFYKLNLTKNEESEAGIESYENALVRFQTALIEIGNNTNDNDKILVISHASAIHNFCLNIGFNIPKLTNCESLVLHYDKFTQKFSL
jgi:broad specificity phosphatase PhoE